MTETSTATDETDKAEADAIARRLDDETIVVAFGWFSFGAKASVTSNPPHANMKARQPALDQLLAEKLITHEHEADKRLGIDRHHFKGTWRLMDVLHSEHGQAVLKKAMDAR